MNHHVCKFHKWNFHWPQKQCTPSNLLSLAPQPSVGLRLLHKIWLNFLEASQQFSFLQGRVVSPMPNLHPGGPGLRVATHFSCLLQHAWVTVGLLISWSPHGQLLQTYHALNDHLHGKCDTWNRNEAFILCNMIHCWYIFIFREASFMISANLTSSEWNILEKSTTLWTLTTENSFK
jgi:hypothetical protein